MPFPIPRLPERLKRLRREQHQQQQQQRTQSTNSPPNPEPRYPCTTDFDSPASLAERTRRVLEHQHQRPRTRNTKHDANTNRNRNCKILPATSLALTPASPRHVLRKAHRATRRCAFFRRLPREIRDEVYKYLFTFSSSGVRLAYKFHETDAEERAWEGWGAEVISWLVTGKDAEEGDGGRARGRWTFGYGGCVYAQGSRTEGLGWWEERGCVELGVGRTRNKNGRSRCECGFTLGRGRGEGLGVVGWMVSCRQAYTESLRPLYALNAFTLCNLTPFSLTSYLPSLLPRSHTSLITSLSIPFLALPLGRTGHTALADTLVTYFPNLRVLRLAVFHPFPDKFKGDYARLIAVLRRVVERLGRQIRHCELVVPFGETYVALGGGKGEGDAEGEEEGEGREKENELVGDGYKASFWEPVGLADGGQSGFWVARSTGPWKPRRL